MTIKVAHGGLQRWHETGGVDSGTQTPVGQLYHGFLRLLERDFARHHDAGHYSELLRVPPAALSRSLAQVSGQTTKELITDRVMLEAARLLPSAT